MAKYTDRPWITKPDGLRYQDNWLILDGKLQNLPFFPKEGAATAEEAQSNPAAFSVSESFLNETIPYQPGSWNWEDGPPPTYGEMNGSALTTADQARSGRDSFLEKTLGKYLVDPLISGGEAIADVGEGALSFLDKQAENIAIASAIAMAVATGYYSTLPELAAATGVSEAAIATAAETVPELGAALAGAGLTEGAGATAGGLLDVAALTGATGSGALLEGGGLLAGAGATGTGALLGLEGGSLPGLVEIAGIASGGKSIYDILSDGEGIPDLGDLAGDITNLGGNDSSIWDKVTDFTAEDAWNSLKGFGGSVLDWVKGNPQLATLIGLGGLSYLSSDQQNKAQEDQWNKVMETWQNTAFLKPEAVKAMTNQAYAQNASLMNKARTSYFDTSAARGMRPASGQLSAGLGNLEAEGMKSLSENLWNISKAANTPMWSPQGLPTNTPDSWMKGLTDIASTFAGMNMYKYLYPDKD